MTYNAIRCEKCGDVQVSKHRHDMRTCNCSNGTFIDGGFDYIRAGGADLTLVTVGTYNEESKTFIPWESKDEN